MDLSIIFVNYNDRRHLEECLTSLQKNALSFSHEIIVVDNASTDGSYEPVGHKFREVRWISLSENAGFSKANNRGARESRGDFLLFLNTDTVVPPGALTGLLENLRSDESAGAAGPALYRGRSKFQVSFGRSVDFFAQFRQKIFLNPYYKIALKKSRKKRETGWLSAACFLCRRTAFERMGGFDENFFIYFEDIDLCLRMRKAGWKLIYLPRIAVFHEGGGATSGRPGLSRYEYRKSQMYFYQKHNSKASLGLLRFYLRLNMGLLALGGKFKGEEGRVLREKYRRLLKKSPTELMSG
jgi:hypothetical protein